MSNNRYMNLRNKLIMFDAVTEASQLSISDHHQHKSSICTSLTNDLPFSSPGQATTDELHIV